MSSYTGSRPDSAIKKKMGMSPQNTNNNGQRNNKTDFKNLLFYNNKVDQKKLIQDNCLVTKSKSKEKPVVAHKKVSSLNIKTAAIAKSGVKHHKGMSGILGKQKPYMDQNSLALEQILAS
jgi:hypothetical protein